MTSTINNRTDTDTLKQTIVAALEDIKGIDIVVLAIGHLTSFADDMIFCSGTSTRHVKALANNVIIDAKKAGFNVKMEGEQEGEWILLDLGDIIVHVMLPQTREFYDIEALWQANRKVVSD